MTQPQIIGSCQLLTTKKILKKKKSYRILKVLERIVIKDAEKKKNPAKVPVSWQPNNSLFYYFDIENTKITMGGCSVQSTIGAARYDKIEIKNTMAKK